MIPWLVLLFFLATLSSQSAMDLFASLLTLVFLWELARTARTGGPWRELFKRTGFEWVWAVWIMAILLSFALSPLQDTKWLKATLEFRWIFFLYVLAWAFRSMGLQPRHQRAASVWLALCSAYAIAVWFLGFDPIHPDYNLAPWSGGIRTGGLLSNAMTFAHLYGVYFCLFTGLLLSAWSARAREWKFLAPAVLLTGVALLLSFTRGAWAGLAVATVVMAFIARPLWGVIASALGGVLIAGALAAWPVLRERVTQAFVSGDERNWIWKAHSRIFLDHPWTGVGYGENFRLVPEYYERLGAPEGVLVSHAHNQYLHFLAGTGIVGLGCYLLALGFLFALNVRVYRAIEPGRGFEKGLALGCLGAQVFFWMGGLTEANFEHSKMKYVMVVIWALVLWLAHELRVTPLRRPPGIRDQGRET